jgi:hypothetical protein
VLVVAAGLALMELVAVAQEALAVVEPVQALAAAKEATELLERQILVVVVAVLRIAEAHLVLEGLVVQEWLFFPCQQLLIQIQPQDRQQ